MAELVLPAEALRNDLIAQWVRDNGLCVEAYTGDELAVALAASIRPAQLIVCADTMSESDLRASVALHPGRVVITAMDHVALLADAVGHGHQRIVVHVRGAVAAGFRFDTAAFDAAIERILGLRALALLGLYCDLGAGEDESSACAAAIADMIIEMARIRRHHDMVLTRLGLAGGCLIPSGGQGLPQLAEQIDEALGEACARLRFPRPRVDVFPRL